MEKIKMAADKYTGQECIILYTYCVSYITRMENLLGSSFKPINNRYKSLRK